MPDNITRISDLPENITMQVQPGQGQGQENATNYVPLNIHPNPYGIDEAVPNRIPLPQSSPPRNEQSIQSNQLPTQYNPDPLAGMPQQTLPMRDIPMNTHEYTQDVEMIPNYIPKVKLTSDYIKEYEAASEVTRKRHEDKKCQERTNNDLFSSLQIPILVAILYFIFQMPIVNTLFRKYLSFLSLYKEDGNFNLSGLLLKSSLFGSLFYMIHSICEKIAN